MQYTSVTCSEVTRPGSYMAVGAAFTGGAFLGKARREREFIKYDRLRYEHLGSGSLARGWRHQTKYGASDLGSSDGRGLDGVRVIGNGRTHKAQVNHGKAEFEAYPENCVVEDLLGSRHGALKFNIVETSVVGRAQSQRKVRAQGRMDGFAVVFLEAASHVCQQRQGFRGGTNRRVQYLGFHGCIIAANAEDKMGGILR